jgi:hypothetical protein
MTTPPTDNPAPNPPPTDNPTPTKGARGCLLGIVVAIVIAFVFGFGMTAIVSPWGFFMGGHFHAYPQWKGWGRLQSSTAGDFVLLLSMVPGTPARHGGPQVKGNAVLCTQRGEKYDLTISGEFENHFGLDFQGKKVWLGMSSSSFAARNFGGDRRPKLHLQGKWDNPNLVMDDWGSLSHAFEPDGSLYKGDFKNRPNSRETVPITLNEGSKTDFEAACKAVKR